VIFESLGRPGASKKDSQPRRLAVSEVYDSSTIPFIAAVVPPSRGGLHASSNRFALHWFDNSNSVGRNSCSSLSAVPLEGKQTSRCIHPETQSKVISVEDQHRFSYCCAVPPLRA
jgi:hypothetical protein